MFSVDSTVSEMVQKDESCLGEVECSEGGSRLGHIYYYDRHRLSVIRPTQAKAKPHAESVFCLVWPQTPPITTTGSMR